MRIFRHSIFTAALLISFSTAYTLARASNLRAPEGPALQVLDQGWKRHVQRPWLDTPGWFVEADRPDVRGFQYRASVRNNAGKTVREVEWEYQFLNPSDATLAARHSFRTEARIRPGKVKELTGFSVEPPTYVVATKADAAGGQAYNYLERVAVRAIVFEDGSRLTF
ncbi:MAG: hypothetical protein M3444_12915 [Acidobacteriota bacterium]|nr:hypothetical protein [Acidobacteriota bacterium]